MQRFIVLLLFGSIAFFNCFSQQISTEKKTAIKAYNDGLFYYTNNNYPKAIELLKESIQSDEKFIEAYLVLAEVYEANNQDDKAIETYIKGLPINPRRHPYGYVKLAKLEFNLGRYDKAKASYNTFLEMKIEDAEYNRKAKDGIKRCEFALWSVNNPVEFKPENLGANINTTNDEYWPCLTADESTLVITRQVPDSTAYMKKQEDFYISERTYEGWSMMRNVGLPLNTNGNEGAQTISADGRTMVFTACNRSGGAGRCDLYISKKEGDKWNTPKNIGAAINTKYTETQPSISADGKTLYFASDRPGGIGTVDLYVSTLNDQGIWRTPVNLNVPVNSQGQEMSPFIHPDGRTLYFSSDEHTGLGGFDIFISRRDSAGKWSPPKNIGYPINTNTDEIGFIVNARGNMAYFSSSINKETGKDIYRFELYKLARPAEVSYMKGKVFDNDTRLPLNADFELIDLETGNMAFNAHSDSISGEFLVCIPSDRNYLLNVSKTGYLFYSDNFAFKGIYAIAKPFLKDVPLLPIKIGETIILKNIFFDFNSHFLKEESKIELNRLVKFLTQYPTVKIEVSGHTDSIGTQEYNVTLSENRAKEVTTYLMNSGISQNRLSFKGYGFERPIAENKSEEGRSQNRRTEVTVISN